jgi:transcriptional regulator with XRE-family HTH domain
VSQWVTDVDKHIGRQVRILRKVRKWTQTELGALISRSPAQISGYETGQKAISATLVWNLSRALKVQVAELFPK